MKTRTKPEPGMNTETKHTLTRSQRRAKLDQALALLRWRWPPPMFIHEIEGGKIVGASFFDSGEATGWPLKIPDLDSLDVLHDMEKELTMEQQKIYAAYLHPGEIHHYLMADFLVAHSTADQRREALLKTLGLWKE